MTSGWLDTTEGCPPNTKYLLKEATIIGEIQRQDAVNRNLQLVPYHIGMGSGWSDLLVKLNPSAHKKDAIECFQDGMDKALLAYQLACYALDPWDDSARVAINKTRDRLRSRIGRIEGTDVTSSELLDMIKDYERVKRARKSKKRGA